MVQSAENLFEKLHECEITEETIKEHLESIAIKQRTRVCPVLSAMDKKNVYVPEYLIPIDEIERVVKISQTRSDDAQKSDVNEMAEDIAAQGQLTGICVILKDGSIVVAWGNHRFEAITDLATQGIPTEPGEPETKGYIWVSLFDRPTSTLPGLQSLENEIHTPAKRAKKPTA